jgi:RimJ/RimL family protein N-acetyltransferase
MPEPIRGVRLVPLTEEHVDGMAEIVGDPDSLRFTRVPEPPPANFAATWIQRYVHGRTTGERDAWAVVDEDGRFLGTGMLPVIDAVSSTAEIGYVVAPGVRGRGVATAALGLLTDRALELGMERIELHIAVENAASQTVAARCGYQLEGVHRSEYWKPGLRADTQVWSLLPTDPRPPRG